MFSIVSLNTLNQTGPAVFALSVLRAIRAPKGVLSSYNTAAFIVPCHAVYDMAWYVRVIRRCKQRHCVMQPLYVHSNVVIDSAH